MTEEEKEKAETPSDVDLTAVPVESDHGEEPDIMEMFGLKSQTPEEEEVTYDLDQMKPEPEPAPEVSDQNKPIPKEPLTPEPPAAESPEALVEPKVESGSGSD